MSLWSPEHHPPEEEGDRQTEEKEGCEEQHDVKVVVLVEWHLEKGAILENLLHQHLKLGLWNDW